MKKEKIYAIVCYVVALCLYLAAAIKLFGGDDASMGVTWLCLGSSMLCFGGVFLNNANKNDEDK